MFLELLSAEPDGELEAIWTPVLYYTAIGIGKSRCVGEEARDKEDGSGKCRRLSRSRGTAHLLTFWVNNDDDNVILLHHEFSSIATDELRLM
jgi:hypothetical protein